MYFGMAVLALAADRLHCQWTAGRAVTEGVTFGAYPWPRDFQQVLIHRAVRIMAVQAVLAHRRMFEQERSALLGMARVAIVVDRIRPQQRLGGAAVRIMTIRAGDLAFAQRHV